MVAWFFIPSFPDQNDFLTPEQTKLVLRRIDEDRGDAIPDVMTTAIVLTHMRDWTLWAHGQPSYGIWFLLALIPLPRNYGHVFGNASM